MEERWSEMIAQGKQKYRLINIVAKRARQINEGWRPAVPAEGLDPISAAIGELKADKLRVTVATDTSGEEKQSGEEA